MTPIRYSLHYEDYSEHLMSRFGKLLQMQSLVDMTLMCSSHTLRVHKTVLAASSAYFQEVLQKQMGEPLIILKMRFSVLKCLVEFMYSGKTQCLEENLDELVSAAQFLKIKGLSKVTKEGLGIANAGELPVFTPPVVINRPPKTLIDQHSQDNNDHKAAQAHSQLTAGNSTSQPMDAFGRQNKVQQDTLVRIPFDIENSTSMKTNVDYPDLPRSIKSRRGRPSIRRPGGWDGPGSFSRAAERALLRREQDSRKAIHQLKHLQTRHMQDYMDRVTLSQAVNSICGPESSSYMNNDLVYMNQNVSNVPFKDNMTDNTTSNYSNTSTTNSINDSNGDGISTAMSQYVNALKSAGLPTDLPILFESGDGSYINVNEQVLLDMVQSSEIQYEVIEQPNIIEKVADPSEIKSIDDLSKSIERGEMRMNNKIYSQNDYNKDPAQFDRPEDGMSSLNTILPDNLEPFSEQSSYVVLDRLQDNHNSLDNVSANDFSCIDGDMQFFTKSMSDDVKKYYQDHQLSDSRVMEQLCPTSSSLDTSFNIALLDGKSSQMNETLSEQFSSLNTEALRRSEDCYDFSLQLPQSNMFKDDLDCLIATPRRNDDDGNSFAQAKEEIIKDLMSIESKMKMSEEINPTVDNTNGDMLNAGDLNKHETVDNNTNLSTNITSSSLRWDDSGISDEPCGNNTEESSAMNNENNGSDETAETDFPKSALDLNPAVNIKSESWDSIMDDDGDTGNKENETSTTNEDILNSDLENDIPYAVGLLPLKHAQQTEEPSLLKRKHPIDLLDSEDAKCLKRKSKKKL